MPLYDPKRLDVPDVVESAIAAWIQRELAKQPWWQRKSNTVVGFVSMAVLVAWFLTGSNLNLPEWVTYGIGVIFFVGGVLGLNVTPNGVTPRTGAKLQEAVREPLVLNAIALEVEKLLPFDINGDGRHRSD